jgi:hypothetical protein
VLVLLVLLRLADVRCVVVASNHCLLGGLLGTRLDSTSLLPRRPPREHFLPKTEFLAKHKSASCVPRAFFSSFLHNQQQQQHQQSITISFLQPILAR